MRQLEELFRSSWYNFAQVLRCFLLFLGIRSESDAPKVQGDHLSDFTHVSLDIREVLAFEEGVLLAKVTIAFTNLSLLSLRSRSLANTDGLNQLECYFSDGQAGLAIVNFYDGPSGLGGIEHILLESDTEFGLARHLRETAWTLLGVDFDAEAAGAELHSLIESLRLHQSERLFVHNQVVLVLHIQLLG